MSAHKILIADADPAVHQEVEKALAGKGYELAYAVDGEQALERADWMKPDVLIIAPDLPGMDGATVVRTLRTKPEHAMIPAIFLADRATVEPRIKGFMIGADDFLPKPLSPAHLDERLEAAKLKSEKTESTIRTAPEEAEFSVVMTGFRGSLEQIGLPSLMTLMEIERKSGQLVIVLEDLGDKARLFFFEGKVVRATLDKRPAPRNAELIYQLFGRTKGKFDFRPSGVDGKDEIKLPTAMLLLEGARLMDEANRKAKGL